MDDMCRQLMFVLFCDTAYWLFGVPRNFAVVIAIPQ